MSRPSLLIVQTGSAVEPARRRHGDFDRWFRLGLGSEPFDFEVVRVDLGQALPVPGTDRRLAGAVVTGSPAMVSDRHAWSEHTAAWLAAAHRAGLPLLGVCYGHQLLAHALGGRVGPNPRGRRMGTFELALDAGGDPLMGGLGASTAVHVTHLEAVLQCPPGARVLARAEHDPYHALYFGQASWGVQFHPEFDDSIMKEYIHARSEDLEAEGQDSAALLAAVRPAPAGGFLLDRFARFCMRLQDSPRAVGS